MKTSTEPVIEARGRKELDAIAELARTVARKVIDPRAAEIDRSHEFPADVAAALAESGLLSAAIPEQYGGGGAGMGTPERILRSVSRRSSACVTWPV